MQDAELNKIVSYGGYSSTGGSVIRDIFKEFKQKIDLSIEFRLLKERFGLLDLEFAIFNSASPEQINLAIRDFLWLSKNLARNSSRFSKRGFNYDLFTNNAFSLSTHRFIDEISDYKYPMYWHFDDFEKSYLSELSFRMCKKISPKLYNKIKEKKLSIMAYPSREKYFFAARKYINTILSGIKEFNNCDNNSIIGLHNAIPCFSNDLINRSIAYFQSCKIILIERDPRDTFINLQKNVYGRYLPRTNNIMKKVKSFVHFYKSIRKNKQSVINHPNILFLKFEDLCFNYENKLQEILNFVEINKDEHINKGKVFSPEKSIKNIEVWKNCEQDMIEAISFIEKELNEDLYIKNI